MSGSMNPQAKAAYLAGMFDNDLSLQIARNGRNSWRVRISKTSQNVGIPVTLRDKSGVGSLFQTQRGTRWCLESQEDVRHFLQTIEPYVEIRKEELETALKFCDTTQIRDWAVLLEEWKQVRS